MKDDIHKKNAKKREGYAEVEVNYYGEENLRRQPLLLKVPSYKLHKKLRYFITFKLNKVVVTRILQSGGCRKI